MRSRATARRSRSSMRSWSARLRAVSSCAIASKASRSPGRRPSAKFRRPGRSRTAWPLSATARAPARSPRSPPRPVTSRRRPGAAATASSLHPCSVRWPMSCSSMRRSSSRSARCSRRSARSCSTDHRGPARRSSRSSLRGSCRMATRNAPKWFSSIRRMPTKTSSRATGLGSPAAWPASSSYQGPCAASRHWPTPIGPTSTS